MTLAFFSLGFDMSWLSQEQRQLRELIGAIRALAVIVLLDPSIVVLR